MRQFNQDEAEAKASAGFENVHFPKLRAARANHVFHTDEKRIRMENTVLVKGR
jgi:hypothetical protein